jgi:hypothetical protein
MNQNKEFGVGLINPAGVPPPSLLCALAPRTHTKAMSANNDQCAAVCKPYKNNGPAPNSTPPPLCGVLCALTPRAMHAPQGRVRRRRRDVLLCTHHINTRRPYTPFPLCTDAGHATALSPHNALPPLLHVRLNPVRLVHARVANKHNEVAHVSNLEKHTPHTSVAEPGAFEGYLWYRQRR